MDMANFLWFTNPNGTVGIAQVSYKNGETKYFIGVVTGIETKIDEQMLLDWGNRFPEFAGNALFNGKNVLSSSDKKHLKRLEKELRAESESKMRVVMDDFFRSQQINKQIEEAYPSVKEPPF